MARWSWRRPAVLSVEGSTISGSILRRAGIQLAVSTAPIPDGRAQRAAAPKALIPCPEDWIREHFAHVWRALRRFGLSVADADDAAQQVFLTAVQRAHDVQPGRERAFLYGVAANVAFKFRRKAARLREELIDPQRTEAPSPSGEELVDRQRARELLDRVLQKLDYDVRIVFVLAEIEELTGPEIAEVLSVPLGTVASRLRRGREQFAQGVAQLRRSLGGPP